MDLNSYLQRLKGRRVAVLGIGVSNLPLLRLLAAAGAEITACDKKGRERLGAALSEELEALGVTLHLGEDYLKGLDQEIIYRTPGLRPDLPEIAAAVEQGSVLTSEMEAFFKVCPCHILGITGSDGKTTTSTIIAGLLEQAGHKVWLGGNIGTPLLDKAGEMQPEDWAVLELSSFQLMTMRKSPEIAVVTNLTPNHLDMHIDMEEYVHAKQNIYLSQGPEDRLVLNRDNEYTLAFGASAPGQCSFFSAKAQTDPGVFLRDGAIWRRRDGEETRVLDTAGILLRGDHNVANYMAAIAAVEGLVPDDMIRDFAAHFRGVEHRLELVREKDGVRFYNDSIASSPSRTIAGLRSFDQKLILIAGGYDKHIPFAPLGKEAVERVKLLVLTGATAEPIRQAVLEAPGYEEGKPEILMVEDFAEAIRTAADRAEAGDIVLLSPACASFDRFPNFAKRGEAFKEIVSSL